MKTILIFAHQNFNKSVSNKELLKHIQNVDFHDISGLTMTREVAEKEVELLGKYDQIIFQYPIYWYSAPGILQTYLERVLVPPIFYTIDGTDPKYKGKIIKFVSTTHGSSEYYNEKRIQVIEQKNIMISEFCSLKYGGTWFKFGNQELSDEKIQSYVKFISE